MAVSHLEVLVEEPSMEAALRGILPGLLGNTSFEVYAHQCKEDLLAQLPGRLRGYSHFIPEDWRILVLVDRDDDECADLKNQLEQIAFESQLSTRSSTGGTNYVVLNRIAIEELEAWYFGDWQAVRDIYPKLPASIPMRAKFRHPDQILGGTWEAFERVCQKVGYFKGGLRKIEAATAIAPAMVSSRSTSRSFQVLRDALLEMVSQV
jgi:hypothetical protein